MLARKYTFVIAIFNNHQSLTEGLY